MGSKNWAAAEVVNAADFNAVLANQVVMVFADATARDAGFGGTGEPTLAEGMVCYLSDVNQLQTYDGSAWRFDGEWISFTPTFNNVTLGASGTVIGKYAQVNNIVYWQASFDLNTTGSITGSVFMNLPVGTSVKPITYPINSTGWNRPAGITIFNHMGFTSAAAVYFYAYVTSGSYSTASALNATVPATWDANGEFYATGWYELA